MPYENGVPVELRRAVTPEEERLLRILGNPTKDELVVVAAVLKALRNRTPSLDVEGAQRRAYLLIEPGGTITAQQLSEITGTSKSMAARHLLSLYEKGLLTRQRREFTWERRNGKKGGAAFYYEYQRATD